MTRINTNVAALVVQRNLIAAAGMQQRSLERLSTGLRINRAADDPAGLMASVRLRSEIVALETAMSNATRAQDLVATAEAGLEEIHGLLLDVQGLVDEAANSGGMTDEEIEANQLLIDEAIESINRIAATTEFNGQNLLDGTLGGYTATTGAEIEAVTTNYADTSGGTVDLVLDYGHDTEPAEKAFLEVLAADVGSVAGEVTLSGNKGAATVDFGAGGHTAAELAEIINAVSDETGIVATENTDLELRSEEYGSGEFVAVSLSDGAVMATQDADGSAASADFGQDLNVTSVDSITGQNNLDGVSVDGLTVTVNRADLDIVIEVAEGDAAAAAGSSASFSIEGNGGARFQIGAEISSANQVLVPIDSVDADHLGTTAALSTLADGGANDLDSGNLVTASTVVTEAISQVATIRGRLGAVETNALESQIRSLGTVRENILSAESAIRDTDFAAEMANLTRAQILMQAGTSVLALANSAPQSVLSLFTG